MRKYLFFLFGLLVMFTPLESHAQSYELGFACFYDGYWGSWYNTSNYNIWGNYGGFIVYNSYEHPSNYRFKFQINSYTQPSKDEIKAHWRNKQPFVYYGTAEYYVSDIDTTIKQILKNYGMPVLTSSSSNAVKRTVSAEIRILPYKKHPVCYNIFFDDVGFAISLGTALFPK